MKKVDFDKHMQGIIDRIIELRDAGQKEYAHGKTDNVFNNFERGAEHLGIDRKHILMIHAMKHLDGINAYLKGHRSQREPIHGRIMDLIVYMMLLDGMIAEDEAIAKKALGVSTMEFTAKDGTEIKPGDALYLNSEGKVEAKPNTPTANHKCQPARAFANADDEPVICSGCTVSLKFVKPYACGSLRFCGRQCHENNAEH